MMDRDGSQKARFADLNHVSSIKPCGHFVILELDGPELPALVRVNRDGTHMQPAIGHLWSPICSADGQFVFFTPQHNNHQTSGESPLIRVNLRE